MPARTPHPELTRNLALIGGRGSGKSSVTKRLARRNRNFMLFSLDALIRYERGDTATPPTPAVAEARSSMARVTPSRREPLVAAHS